MKRPVLVEYRVLGDPVLVNPAKVLVSVRLRRVFVPDSSRQARIIAAKDMQSAVEPTQFAFKLATQHLDSVAEVGFAPTTFGV